MEYTIIYVLLVSLTVYAMNYVVYYIILCPLGWDQSIINILWVFTSSTRKKFYLTSTICSVSMISSIKYISPALFFNKSFLKSYQYLVSLLYFIQSLWLYLDLVTNKFVISLLSICWFHNDCLLVHCSYNSKSCSVIMLFIIAVISTYIII